MGFAMHLRYCNLLLPDERSCQIIFTDTRARETKFYIWLHLPLFYQWFKMHVVKRVG